MAWPRAVHSAEPLPLASVTHGAVTMHDGSQSDSNDDTGASLALEDNGGMDDMRHLARMLDLGLTPAGSNSFAMGHYAVRPRDIAQLLRPPEVG